MRFFAVFAVLMLLVIPSFVSAGLGQDVADRIMDVLNYEIPAPAYVVDQEGGYSGLPFWVVILTFMLIFSIIWLGALTLPIFKDQPSQGPRKAFVIALSLLTIFTTPAVKWILKAIKFFTALTIIALVLAGIYTIYVLTRSSIAKNRKTDAESSRVIADAKRMNAESNRMNEQTKEYKRKTDHAVRHGMTQQLHMIRDMEDQIKNVVNSLHRMHPRLNNPNATVHAGESHRIMRHLNKIAVDLGKLLSYKSANDRILSGMSTRNYIADNAGTLTDINPGAAANDYAGRRVSISQNIDTQTNDLGHAVNGLISLVKYDGIRGSNIGKLTDLALNALNIIQRMKRDIVLEEQMIEKI